MNDQTDNLAGHRLDEEKRQHEAQETERRRLQQIIEDDERHAGECRPRGAGPVVESQRADLAGRDIAPRQAARSPDDVVQRNRAGDEPEAPLSGEVAERNGFWGVGPIGLFVLALLVAASCYAGWQVFKPLRAPATPVDVTANGIDPSPLPLPTAVRADKNATGREVTSPDPAPSRLERAIQPSVAATNPQQIEAAATAPAGSSAMTDLAGLPDPTRPTVKALADEVEPVAQANPPAAVAVESVQPQRDPRITEISGRLDRLELVLADIRNHLATRPEPVVVAAPAPAPAPAVSAPVATPPQPRPSTARKAVKAAARPAPQTTSNGQLLSVDMWGGVPSVVVGTGLPDDKRVRVLKRGDVHNGVALLNVDPVAETATFGANGRSFTLSVNQGG